MTQELPNNFKKINFFIHACPPVGDMGDNWKIIHKWRKPRFHYNKQFDF
jgi:hypothetical protein